MRHYVLKQASYPVADRNIASAFWFTELLTVIAIFGGVVIR
jgi:hypothetical protein